MSVTTRPMAPGVPADASREQREHRDSGGGALKRASFYWAYSARSLRRGGQRTVLAVFCIAVGVMAIVALQLASLMVSNNLTSNVRVANGGDISVHQDVQPFQGPDLAYFAALRKRGEVTAVATLARDRGVTALGAAGHNTGSYPTIIGAVDPAVYPLVGQPTFEQPAHGDLHRFLTAGTTVLSAAAATSLHARVGDTVTIHGAPPRILTARVVGIVGSGGLAGGFDAYVQQAAYARSGGPGAPLEYNVVYLTTASDARTKAAAADIKGRYPLATVATVADALKQRQAQTTQVHELLQIVGILALLIGGFGVVNTMNVLLARRRTEIAMLKTVGYRRRDLYALFGIEAAALGIAGGLIGAVAGIGLSWVVKTLIQNAIPTLSQLPFVVDPLSVFMGVAVGLCTALIFGLLPIVRAARVRPQAVLRDVAERASLGTRAGTVGLVLALSALFFLLASAILEDVRWGFWVVYGTFAALALLGLVFGALVALIGRLPVPERLGGRQALGATLALLAALAVTAALPAVGVLLILVALFGYGVAFLPRPWKAVLKLSLRDIGRGRARATTTLLALFVGVFSVGLMVILGQDVHDKLASAIANLSGYNVASIVPAAASGQVDRQLRDLPGLKRYGVVNAAQSFPLGTRVDGQSLFALLSSSHAPQNPKSNNLGVSGTVGFLSGLGGYDVARHQSTGATIAKGDGRDLTPADAMTANVLVNSLLHTDGPLHLKLGDRITLSPLVIRALPGTAAGSSGSSPSASPASAPPARLRPLTVTVVGFYGAGAFDVTHFEPILAPRALVHRFGGAGEQYIYSIKVDPVRIDDAVSRLNSNARGALTINLTSLGAIVDQVLSNLIILLVALASLALFAGVIIIANAVALAMLERRREQGILKSVGYTSGRVLAGVLIENGIIGGLGGTLGVVVAAIATSVLARTLFNTDLAVPSLTSLGLIVLVTVIALLTSALVAWRAVRVRPLEVLRYE